MEHVVVEDAGSRTRTSRLEGDNPQPPALFRRVVARVNQALSVSYVPQVEARARCVCGINIKWARAHQLHRLAITHRLRPAIGAPDRTRTCMPEGPVSEAGAYSKFRHGSMRGSWLDPVAEARVELARAGL